VSFPFPIDHSFGFVFNGLPVDKHGSQTQELGPTELSGTQPRQVLLRSDLFSEVRIPVFVEPRLADATEDGKLLIDLPWDGEAARFADVIGAVKGWPAAKKAEPWHARLVVFG